jgi:hypothetical protein
MDGRAVAMSFPSSYFRGAGEKLRSNWGEMFTIREEMFSQNYEKPECLILEFLADVCFAVTAKQGWEIQCVVLFESGVTKLLTLSENGVEGEG